MPSTKHSDAASQQDWASEQAPAVLELIQYQRPSRLPLSSTFAQEARRRDEERVPDDSYKVDPGTPTRNQTGGVPRRQAGRKDKTASNRRHNWMLRL